MSDNDYYIKKAKKHADTAFYSGIAFAVVLILAIGWNLLRWFFGLA